MVCLGVALGASALAGCAPLASFRPPSGLEPEKTLELGLGGAVVTPRPYVIEETRGTAQVWVSNDLGRVVNLSLLAAFDDQAMAMGGAVRLRYLHGERFSAAAEAELGYAWAAVSLPVALRLVDRTHLYAAPRLGTWGLEPIGSVLAGASVGIFEGFYLRAEWQRSFQDFESYNRRDHVGVAAAYQF